MRVWSCTHEKKKASKTLRGLGAGACSTEKFEVRAISKEDRMFPGYFQAPLFRTVFFHFPWDFEIAGFRSTVNQKLLFFGKHVFYVTWHVLVQSQIEMHAIRLVASGDAGTNSSQPKWRTLYQGQGAGEVRNRANRSLKGELEASFLLMHLRISVALHCYRCCKSWTM